MSTPVILSRLVAAGGHFALLWVMKRRGSCEGWVPELYSAAAVFGSAANAVFIARVVNPSLDLPGDSADFEWLLTSIAVSLAAAGAALAWRVRRRPFDPLLRFVRS
jgi:MYXO-CTERM domain-containing protein